MKHLLVLAAFCLTLPVAAQHAVQTDIRSTVIYFAVPTGSYEAQFPVQPAQEIGRIEPGRQSVSVYRMVADFYPPLPESDYKAREFETIFRALEYYVRAQRRGEDAWILTLKDETTILVTRKR